MLVRGFVYCPPLTCFFGPGSTSVWTHCGLCPGYRPVRLILLLWLVQPGRWGSGGCGPLAARRPHFAALQEAPGSSVRFRPGGPGGGRFCRSLGRPLEKGAQRPPSGLRGAPAAAVCLLPGGLRAMCAACTVPRTDRAVSSFLCTSPVSPPDPAALTAPRAALAGPRGSCAPRLWSSRHEADPGCSFFPGTRGTEVCLRRYVEACFSFREVSTAARQRLGRGGGRGGQDSFALLAPPARGADAPPSWTEKPPCSAGASGSAVLAGVHRGPASGPRLRASLLHTDPPMSSPPVLAGADPFHGRTRRRKLYLYFW